MAKEYLNQLIELMEPATARRFKNSKLEYKHFFSGAAVYAEGRICISLTPAGFALKLPEKNREELLGGKGTKNLRYFPNGPIKKDYVVLPNNMVNDLKTLQKWVKKSIEYALTLALPTKKKKQKKEPKNP